MLKEKKKEKKKIKILGSIHPSLVTMWSGVWNSRTGLTCRFVCSLGTDDNNVSP